MDPAEDDQREEKEFVGVDPRELDYLRGVAEALKTPYSHVDSAREGLKIGIQHAADNETWWSKKLKTTEAALTVIGLLTTGFITVLTFLWQANSRFTQISERSTEAVALSNKASAKLEVLQTGISELRYRVDTISDQLKTAAVERADIRGRLDAVAKDREAVALAQVRSEQELVDLRIRLGRIEDHRGKLRERPPPDTVVPRKTIDETDWSK